MITMHDLDEAIAECQGQPHPNANTCIKLAAYLTIKESMTEKDSTSGGVSFAAQPQQAGLDSGSAFAKKIEGLPAEKVLALFDEVMDTLQVVNPRLYAAIMRKL